MTTEQRLNVNAIIPQVQEWTCNVLVVDKFRPRETKSQTINFQTIILQDENEEQVAIVLYADDITRCRRLFTLFETYLVSGARVRDPRGYSIRADKFEWVLDKHTTVVAITNRQADDAPLPLPRKLNALPFSNLELQLPGVEFDLLAVVANCSAMQYTSDQTKRFREAIVMDNNNKPFMFTMWDDLVDNEGAELLQQLHDHPVILAKWIAVTEYRRVLRLTTRYASTILINPPYVQATELMHWSKENERMLAAYTLRSSSESSSSLNLASAEDETVSISDISSLSATVQTFHVEGQISLPNYSQSFYMLACSNCNHFVRSKVRREVHCLNCDLPRMLVPRCHFELDITDNSGTLTTMVSETLAKKILSMTAEQVYEIVAAQNQSLLVAHINREFGHRLFSLQLLRPLFRFPDQKMGALAISSYTEKQSPTFMLPSKATKKQKLEPRTPTKKQ